MVTTNPTSQLQRDETASEVVYARGRYLLRKPTASDGRVVWELIANCPPLDTNSPYCNLLQCTHFADTCIVAEQDGRIRGWVSAYRPPAEPQTLFIWQVAIHPDARGCGVARALIRALLQREAAQDVRRLQATIIPDNRASWALFRSLAKCLNAPFTSREHFDSEKHFGRQHQSEHMITIGPWDTSDTAELWSRRPA